MGFDGDGEADRRRGLAKRAACQRRIASLRAASLASSGPARNADEPFPLRRHQEGDRNAGRPPTQGSLLDATERSAWRRPAMSRVLVEAAESKRTLAAMPPSPEMASPFITMAFDVQHRFAKSAFEELRSACVKSGSQLTAEFLELENKIDLLEGMSIADPIKMPRIEKRLEDRIAEIEAKATRLHDEAAAGMRRANANIAEAETEPPIATSI
jgi:hypothetical protein